MAHMQAKVGGSFFCCDNGGRRGLPYMSDNRLGQGTGFTTRCHIAPPPLFAFRSSGTRPASPPTISYEGS